MNQGSKRPVCGGLGGAEGGHWTVYQQVKAYPMFMGRPNEPHWNGHATHRKLSTQHSLHWNDKDTSYGTRRSPSPERTYKWPRDTSKNAQHVSSSRTRQLKKTTKYRPTSAGIVAIDRTSKKCLVRVGRTGYSSTMLMGMRTTAAPGKINVVFPPKIRNWTAFWPSDPPSWNIA